MPQSRRAGTRQEIARGALRALRNHGWEDVGTREVAAEAGVSLGQLHYYFESKDALLLAAAQLYFDEALERFLARAEGKDALSLVRAIVEGAHFDRSNPEGVARVRIQAEARIRALRDGGLAPIVIRYRRALRDVLAESFREAGLAQPRAGALAVIVLDFLESFTPHRVLDAASVDVAATEGMFLEMVERELRGAGEGDRSEKADADG